MALVGAVGSARAQPDAVGVRGGVTNHEGTPLTEGTVTLTSLDRSSILTASLDQSGRFQIVPTVAGRHRLTILAPGYAPRLVDVIVPSSRTIALPTLLLEAPAYFRARFVNGDGDVIVSPVIRRRSVGVDGVSFPGAGVDDPRASTLTAASSSDRFRSASRRWRWTCRGWRKRGCRISRCGPPRAARRRHHRHPPGRWCALRSSTATAHPSPITRSSIEDAQPNSPLAVRTVRTDHVGRATFDRLGDGRYFVGASMIDRCNGRGVPLSTGQLVSVNGTGSAGVRIAVEGLAALRITPKVDRWPAGLCSWRPTRMRARPIRARSRCRAGRRSSSRRRRAPAAPTATAARRSRTCRRALRASAFGSTTRRSSARSHWEVTVARSRSRCRTASSNCA